MSCNHVWRDTLSPKTKSSKEILLVSIVGSGTSGWWLRGKEIEYAKELFDEGLIFYCKKCHSAAAFALCKKTSFK